MIPMGVSRCVPGRPGYAVSHDGRIHSLPRSIIRKDGVRNRVRGGELNPHDTGAKLMVGLGARRIMNVGRAVLLAFAGPPPTPDSQCCHVNGNHRDNRPSNLRWGTARENAADAVRHGTTLRGERNAASKLTEGQVRDIRRRLAAGESRRSLARAFGVDKRTVQFIERGRKWGWLQ